MFIAIFKGELFIAEIWHNHAPIEEHNSARIVKLVHLQKRRDQRLHQSSTLYSFADSTHLIEVRNIRNIAQVDNREVLHLFRDLVEGVVHNHTLLVPVVAKADNDDAVLFGLDGLVDVPAGG